MNIDISLIYTYRTTEANEFINVIPPLGIYSISSYVKSVGFRSEVNVVASSELIEKIDEVIKKSRVIGFSCYEDNYVIIFNAIKYIKKHSDCVVFVGGPQAYAIGEGFLRETGCDVISRGDGEYVTEKLLEYFVNEQGELQDVQGIAFLSENKYIDNGVAPLITNLDELPFTNIDYSNEESDIAYIITGRGCAFNCAFCFEGNNSNNVRFRTVENVIEEIKEILNKYPHIKIIQFLDDTFTLNNQRLNSICDFFEKVRKKRDITWMCEAHIELLDKNLDILDKMIKSGLTCLQVGIESGSNKVLVAYNKRTTQEMIIRIVEFCKERGLENLQGNIIIGGAYESEETINDDISMIRKLITVGKGMIEINTTFFWPFSNTKITNNPDEYGIKIVKEEVDKAILSMRAPVTESKTMNIKQMIFAKKRMDMILSAACKDACMEMSLNEVEKHWDAVGKRFVGFWGSFLRQFDYFTNMMLVNKHAVRDVSRYDLSEIFTIRTIHNLQYKNDKLIFGNKELSRVQQAIIENSNGKVSMKELSDICGISSDEILKECQELRDKCYIYYSLV